MNYCGNFIVDEYGSYVEVYEKTENNQRGQCLIAGEKDALFDLGLVLIGTCR